MNKINKPLILILFIIILLYVLYYLFEVNEYFELTMKVRTLNKDGFCVLYNPLYATNTIDIPCINLKLDVYKLLPPNYVFIDYVYKIKNGSLSTFHRDVTSSQHLFKTKNPIYTLILYKYYGHLLSLCPGSNKTYPFVWSRIINVEGKSGTAFLFDSDVLHAGSLNNCEKRDLIQYKICHKEDLPLLKHLDKVNTEKIAKCNNSYSQVISRKLSYFFEMPINYLFYPLMIKRENKNSISGFIQSFIPISFYNNS